MTRLSEVEYYLKHKQDSLVYDLKWLQSAALKEAYNFTYVEHIVKPLDDLIKEHYLLLNLLYKNKDWIKYSAYISEHSYHNVAVPNPVSIDNYLNIKEEIPEITMTKYSGKDISILLKEFLKNLEPFLKIP